VTEGGWLLDTAILVDVLRGNAAARAWVDSLPSAARFVSFVSSAELLAGCRNRREERTLSRELRLYTTVWLDEPACRLGFDLYNGHHLSHGVGFLDCLVAATARLRGLTVATLNVKHFDPLPEVLVERPY
jgi:predicted nucleic acid-binding protein